MSKGSQLKFLMRCGMLQLGRRECQKRKRECGGCLLACGGWAG